jgi:hypothetical protein
VLQQVRGQLGQPGRRHPDRRGRCSGGYGRGRVECGVGGPYNRAHHPPRTDIPADRRGRRRSRHHAALRLHQRRRGNDLYVLLVSGGVVVVVVIVVVDAVL